MITEENKNLLFRDLSSRFSYGVKVAYTTLSDDMPKVWDVIGLPAVGLVDIIVPGKYRFAAVPVEEIKPYLRPMSSMTEEEMEEFNSVWDNDWRIVLANQIENAFDKDGFHNNSKVLEITACFHAVDWLNAHHFDYRGLIPMGLALEAPDGMYK